MTSIPNSSSPPKGCTNFKLRQLMRRVTQHYDDQMIEVGLKTTQYSLLSAVQNLGPIRPMDLSAHMKLDASTLTRNLKPLVDANWVAVMPGEDARSRLVVITTEGRAKREAAKRQWRKAQERMNELLGLNNVAALHAVIDQAMDKLEGVSEGDQHE